MECVTQSRFRSIDGVSGTLLMRKKKDKKTRKRGNREENEIRKEKKKEERERERKEEKVEWKRKRNKRGADDFLTVNQLAPPRGRSLIKTGEP